MQFVTIFIVIVSLVLSILALFFGLLSYVFPYKTNTQKDLEDKVKTLETSNKDLDDRIKKLETSVDNLETSNKDLDDRIKKLENNQLVTVGGKLTNTNQGAGGFLKYKTPITIEYTGSGSNLGNVPLDYSTVITFRYPEQNRLFQMFVHDGNQKDGYNDAYIRTTTGSDPTQSGSWTPFTKISYTS